jgi:hypothetical protein
MYFHMFHMFGHLNTRVFDRRQFQASYIFCVGLRLVQYCEHVQFHDFIWLLLVAYIIEVGHLASKHLSHNLPPN